MWKCDFLLIIKHLKNLLISLQNRRIFLLGETNIFYIFSVAAPNRAEHEKIVFKTLFILTLKIKEEKN